MKNKRIPLLVIAGVLLATAAVLLIWLKPFGNNEQGTGDQDGEALAKQYCASCHVFPEPRLLDKKTWTEGVLPNMGMRMGIRKPGQNPFDGLDPHEADLVRALNVYPETPIISNTDWEKIVTYYQTHSPNEPEPQQPKAPIADVLAGFSARPVYIGEKQNPFTSMLRFDEQHTQLYIGDGKNELYILKKDLSLASNWFMPSPPVDIDFPKNGPPHLVCIGSMAPTQQRNGNYFTFDPNETAGAAAIRFDSLARPVSVAAGDLNGDNQEDVVICSFGNYTGKLSWFESRIQSKEHILLEQPGARKAEIVDMNKDGRPDVVALMAQGREELVMFLNKGNGDFDMQILQQFPSVYGVSYFDLADFNKDGHPDIIVTNGDNWDLSPIKKYYHGIRILMNDGNNQFKETYFYPSYGAAKALARDFDKDGDLDIAAISFSDDLDKTQHGFIYMKNQGNFNFEISSSPDAAPGKWMTMDVGDFDKDGDDDIAIGSFIYNMAEMSKMVGKGVDKFPNIVVFWNNMK